MMSSINHLQSRLTPTVSIVMPVYNAAGTLRESVDSVMSQTYKNFELIICNDASTDETKNILEEFTDERLRLLNNESNLGEGAARDRAIESASGAWLAVIDADDIWAPERLETLMCDAEKYPDRMIFDDIMRCHDTAQGIVPWEILRGKYAFGCDGINAVDVPTEHFVCEKRLLIKPLLPLKFIKQYKVRHSCRKFAADTEFFFQLLSHGVQLRYIPKPMYYYRITPGSMSGATNRFALMCEVLENAIDQFEHYPNVQSALRIKVNKVAYDEKYMKFLLVLKKKANVQGF